MLERSPSKNLTVTMPVSTTGLRLWSFPKLVASYVLDRCVALRNATWGYRYWVLGASAGLVGVATSLVGAYMFVLPQTINVNFAATNHCVFSPALLGSLPQPADAPFRLYRPSKLAFFGKTVVSTSLCAEPQVGLQAQATYANRLQAVLPGATLTKHLTIRTATYPSLRGTFPAEPVAIAQPQAFVLNSADTTFEYVLTANQQTASCSQHDTLLSCPLQPLKLAYSQTYPVSLERRFKGNYTSTVARGSLTTISATTVTKSSVANGAIVYDKPLTFTLETDKAIARLGAVQLTTKTAEGTTTTIPSTVRAEGTTIIVTVSSDLPRRQAFELTVDDITATDRSHLAAPYKLTFSTSGGPKVNSINIAKTGVLSGQTIVVGFDQAVLAGSNPTQLVTFSVNGVAQPAAMTLSGNKLLITPQGSYPVCARLAIRLTNDAQSTYGISGDSAWNYDARARCYTTYSIGNSVQGRPILAYQFGTNPSMILYVGGTHGAEQNSMVILQKWVSELDANPDSLPANRSIVVIPALNPDGLATASRLNANGIDLNRNFPANNWQTSVTLPGGGGVVTAAGGPQALSEPESQALANFVIAHQPRFVLTYHSHAGIVEANEAGDSVSLATSYAAKALYKAIPHSLIGTTFDYSTTGAFEDWLHDKQAVPAVVVELYSATADEFTRNRSAMWAMTQLP